MTKRQHLAVVAAIVILQLFGWLWYSPLLFLSPWLHGLGREIGQMNSSAKLPFIVSVLGTAVLCYVLAWLVQALNLRTFKQGMGLGAVLGFGLSVPSILTHDAFIGLSWNVAGIDALYSLVAPAIAAGIITAARRFDEDRPSQD